MIERLHFHRGYSLRLHKSKPFINYGIISLREGIVKKAQSDIVKRDGVRQSVCGCRSLRTA